VKDSTVLRHALRSRYKPLRQAAALVITQALQACGKQADAAELLGMSQDTLDRILSENEQLDETARRKGMRYAQKERMNNGQSTD